jgi:hypothetical protein
VSRLDSAIRRLQAQRACLELAVREVAGLPGPVFELGLGNGRTYDHLREHMPEREIFVFERRVTAHPDCIPDPAHLYLGDVLDTLPRAETRFAGRVALIHADIGTGEPARNARLAGRLGPVLGGLLAAGGVLVSDQDITPPGTEAMALPDGVADGRLFLRRKTG